MVPIDEARFLLDHVDKCVQKISHVFDEELTATYQQRHDCSQQLSTSASSVNLNPQDLVAFQC